MRRGKGRGKAFAAQRENPIGKDGQQMLCSICQSKFHFRRECPQNKGGGSSGGRRRGGPSFITNSEPSESSNRAPVQIGGASASSAAPPTQVQQGRSPHSAVLQTAEEGADHPFRGLIEFSENNQRSLMNFSFDGQDPLQSHDAWADAREAATPTVTQASASATPPTPAHSTTEGNAQSSASSASAATPQFDPWTNYRGAIPQSFTLIR